MNSPEAQPIERDWEAVGGFLRQAMEEAALCISSEVAEYVAEKMGKEILPSPDALIYLERLEPGIADWVIARSSEIQQEVHDREWAVANSFKRKAKNLSKGALWLVPPPGNQL